MPSFKNIVFAVALLLTAVPAASAQFAFGGDSPVAVAAEKATYKGGLTVLEGKVDVQQDDTRIQSDTMDIYRAEAGPEVEGSVKLGNVTRIVAKGNFRYAAPDSTVTGDRGVYLRDAGTITVTGNVVFVTPSGSRVEGKKLIYDVNKKSAKFGDTCEGEACDGKRVTFSNKQE